jgi:CHAD domain-containing protein
MNLDLESATSSRVPRAHAGRWLHRLLTQLVQQSLRDIHQVPKWEDQAVHNLRKRMKKLQAMLLFVRPVTPKAALKEVREDVRDLKNVLSSNRDALVMAKLADKLGVAVSFPSPPVPASTKGRLENATALAEKLLIHIGRLDLSTLTWEMVGQIHASSYKASRKAWKKALDEPTPEKLHEWRKKVKRLYYQSTALEPWLHHPKRLRHTRKLGSLLGDCHDLDVFADSVKSGDLHPLQGWKSKVKRERQTVLTRIEQRAEKAISRSPRKIKKQLRHFLLAHV